MINQSTASKQQKNLAMPIGVTFLIIGIAVQTADRLSGKFFPPDSPIFANYYANDFLPWGIFIFLTLGWVTIDFIYKRYTGNPHLLLIITLAGVIGVFVMFCAKLKLQDIQFQGDMQVFWASYLISLINVWSFAWIFGGVSAYGFNRN